MQKNKHVLSTLTLLQLYCISLTISTTLIFLVFLIRSNYSEESWKFFNSTDNLLSHATYQKCNST